MKKRLKIFVLILLVIVAVGFLLNYQAKRIVISLIESNSNDKVKVKIGRINIKPINSSIGLKEVFVLVRGSDSGNFKRINIDAMFLDVASLWDFFLGGTLIIEKFECEGGSLTIFNAKESDPDSHSFDLTSIIHRIKSDAIRFRIEDIVFRDMNLLLTKDTTQAPTAIQHIYARAQNLYLSADSLVRKKPIVEFSIPRQVITLPGELTFGFDSLSFSTTDNSVQVLNLELKSPPAAVRHSYHVHSDKVRMAHFNFESLYGKGDLVIDSIFLGKSTITLDWMMTQSDKDTKKQQGIPALPRIDLGNVAFKEIVADVVIRNDSIQNVFKVEHASLIVDQFRHRPDSSHVIYAPYYNLLITKYATILGSNNAAIRFDTIQIQKHALSLLNFSYHTADQHRPLVTTPRFELKRVDWYELLVNRKLLAEEALAIDPTIVTIINQKKGATTGPIDKFMLVQSLNDFLQVNLFSMKNATAFVKVPDSHLDVVLRGYNTTFNVLDLINSRSVNSGMDAIRDFSFRNLLVSNQDYSLHVENMKFSKREFYVGNLKYDSESHGFINLVGLKLGAINWTEATNSLALDGIDWKSLKADIKRSGKKPNQIGVSNENKIPKIYLENIQGGNLDLLFQNDELRAGSLIDQLNLKEFSITDSIYLNGINIQGNSLVLDTKLNEIRIGSFLISEKGGTMHDISLNRNTGDYLNVSVDKLMLEAHLPDFARQKYVVNSLTLDNMKSRFTSRDSVQNLDLEADSRLIVSNLIYKDKNISIESFFIDVGPFNVIHKTRVPKEVSDTVNTKAGVRKFRVGTDTLVQNKYSVNGFKQPPSRFKLSSSEGSDTSAYTIKTIRLKSERGGIKFDLGGIKSTAHDSSMRVNASIKAIQFSDVDIGTDNLRSWINTGSLNNLVVDSDHAKDVWSMVEDNYPTATIHNMKGSIETKGNLFRFDRLDYDPKAMSGTVRQFEFRPLRDKYQFLEDRYYQTNYMDTRIESIAFNRFNLKRFLKDTVIHLANIQVESPTLEISRDKTKPFFATAVKPLPTNAIQKLKVGFKIDTLKVSDGRISYTEKSRITGREGTINFSQLDALVRNVKNIDLQPDDSLRIRASTLFMDSARVNLRVRESYRDTLGGFLLTTQVSPFNTTILNKALVPMASVDFKSGQVDTLYMRAIGREYLSLGSMKFLYHDLKVEFLDKNDTSRHSLKNQLLKFAANTFVVRTKNTDRVGTVFYERDRNRAVFQYWVKMILSGVTTSVGAKSNKKQIKKYMKELNQKKLPPIDDKLDL